MAISTLFNARHASGQAGIGLENVEASVRFGEYITFVATIKAVIPIQTVSIMISDESQSITHVEPLNLQADGRTEYRFDTKQNILRPFTSVKWNYQFTFPDGTTTQSAAFFVRYADNRFNWQTLETDAAKVNWYHGDATFGQAALDAAQAGLASISRSMPPDLAPPIEIFIYANADDLRGTLVPGGEEWVAGHADPGLGVVMVVIAPGAEQGITMEQRIPHELMHVMLYRRVGSGYHNIPAWLREGMATLAELYPNVDYDRALADATASNSLIPLKELCGSFPADAGQAFLAYAESRSFTNYLHETYGSTRLLNLAAAYADGVDCERGTERAFGVSLSNLETNWRSSVLGQNTFFSTLQNISPYLVLLCLVLIIPLIGIVSTLRKKGNRNE
ncbi:MAG TPA: peptidase MA family metallohydrolase [Anaerolineales bacterium]|nr:peptidase MA family metallohydrolase [Anaerolineales bacterium]